MGLRFPPSGFTDRTASRAGVHYASWLRRFAGFVVDALILYLILQLVGLVFSFVPNPFAGTLFRVLEVVSLGSVAEVLYATMCLDRLDGQTPGMRVAQIRCVPAVGHGRISFTQAVVRSLAAVVVVDGLYLASWGYPIAGLALVLVCFWPLVDARRQTWWDHAADVIVMDTRGW